MTAASHSAVFESPNVEKMTSSGKELPSRSSTFTSLRSLRRLQLRYDNNDETLSAPASVDGRSERSNADTKASHIGTVLSSPSHRTAAAASEAAELMNQPRRPGTSKRSSRRRRGERRTFAGSAFLRRLGMLRARASGKSQPSIPTRSAQTVATTATSPGSVAGQEEPEEDDDVDHDLNVDDFVHAHNVEPSPSADDILHDSITHNSLPHRSPPRREDGEFDIVSSPTPLTPPMSPTSTNQPMHYTPQDTVHWIGQGHDGSTAQLVYHAAVPPTADQCHQQQQEEDARTLFLAGRELYRRGLYPDALSCQRDALSILENQLPPQQVEADSSLCMDLARVRYELTRIDVALHHGCHASVRHLDQSNSDEHHQNNACGDDHATSERAAAVEGAELVRRMKQARMEMNRSKAAHYERELLARRLRTRNNNNNNDSTEGMPADGPEVARILHSLGRLYDEELGRYDDALRCYNEALSIEERDLASTSADHASISPLPVDANEDSADDEETERTKRMNRRKAERIRETRRRIGRLHYKRGEFGLAMTASFSSSYRE